MYATILQYVRSLRLPRVVGVGVAGAIAVAVGGTGCDQSSPLCRTGTGAYTARYTLTAGDSTKCTLKTDILYVNSYNDVGEEGKPDLEKVSAALTPSSLAHLVDDAEARLHIVSPATADPDPNHHPYAWGHFVTAEPVGDFCDIPNPSPAIQNIPVLPGEKGTPADDKGTPDKCDDEAEVPDTPESAATNITYEWTNWHIYFTPAHAGNSFKVHLKTTIDGEVCEYDARAAFFSGRQSCDRGDGTPLPKACDAVAHVDVKLVEPNTDKCDPATGESPFEETSGLSTGSGVDPDFAVECDTDSLLCLLKRDPPSLKGPGDAPL